MFKSKIFYLFILLTAILFGGFIYKKYFFHQAKNQTAYLMKSDSNKLFGTLIITSGTPISQEMSNGFLCIENMSQLDKVDLFMADMGHGSEPPKVTHISTPSELLRYQNTVTDFGCFSIESMQLFMPGTWQVRVFYKNNTMGIFTLNLEK
jgi:hypothetical protein